MVCFEGSRECLRKDVGDFIGVAKIPDDTTSLSLTMNYHASGQVTRFRCRSRLGAAVMKELRCGLKLPGDRCEASHEGVMALARNPVALFQHDADATLHQLKAATN